MKLSDELKKELNWDESEAKLNEIKFSFINVWRQFDYTHWCFYPIGFSRRGMYGSHVFEIAIFNFILVWSWYEAE